MRIIDTDIENYVEKHSSEASPLLNKIERETYLKSIYPRMISGRLQGRFLAMISKMIRPKAILEIGTFTGYSAICLSEGLDDGGMIHTIEINEELKVDNEAYFEEAGLSHKVVSYFGDASAIIPQIGIEFDLIFIDADKINYIRYFELGIEKLRKGGFMLADNVLWSGKVLDTKQTENDKDTRAVADFNEMIRRDARVDHVMVPIRDGVTIIQKVC